MKKTKWIALLIVMVFAFNLVLPFSSAFGASEEFMVVAGDEVNFSQTGIWKKSSSALAHDQSGAPGSYYSSDGSGNATSIYKLPDEAPDGIYEIYYYFTANIKQEMTIRVADKQDKVMTLEDSSTDKRWIKLDGTFEMKQNGDNSVIIRRFSSAEGGGMARATSIKFVKVGDLNDPTPTPDSSKDPSSEPSEAPSTQPTEKPSETPSEPSAIPSFQPQVYSNLDLKENPQEVENWTVLNGTKTETGVPTPEEKSLLFKQTATKQSKLTRTFADPSVAAPQIIMDTTFSLIDGKLNQIVFRNSAASSKVSIQVDFAEKNNTEYSIGYYNGSSTKVDSGYTLKKAYWYRMIVVYEMHAGTYNLYFYNHEGQKEVSIEDITATKGTVPDPLDIGRVEFMLNEQNSQIYLNRLKIYSDPEFSVPVSVPELYPPVEVALPSPEPSPDPNISFYDDETTEVFQLCGVPEVIEGGYSKGTSTTGSASMGDSRRHTFSNIPDTYGLYTLKYAVSGTYEVYFNVPLVHSANTNKMYIEVTDSTGKTTRNIYDIKEGEISGQNAAGDIKTGTMLKLGDNFVFNTKNPGTVKVGAASDEKGFFRTDTIKLVKKEDILSKPFAENVSISGLLKPSAELTGNYEYKQDNGYTEKDSILKWYRGTENNWVEIGSGKTYTLTSDDIGKQIKFEVTPKSNADNIEYQIGDAAATVTAVIPDKDMPATVDIGEIQGDAILGHDLTAQYIYNDVNLDPEGNSSYQWYRSEKQDGPWTPVEQGNCKGEETISYRVQEDDIGNYIRLGITAKSSDLTAEESFSEVIGPIQVTKPVANNLRIEGTLKTGSELTVKYEFSQIDGYDESESQIKWYLFDDSWKEIGQGKTYVITNNDIGKKIKVEVIPQCSLPDGQILSGDTASVETSPIPDKDYPGEAYDLTVSGEPLTYLTLTASYSYRDMNLDPEGESEYIWYISDQKDSGFEELSRGTVKAGEEIQLVLSPEWIGKYIRLGLSVKSSDLVAAEVYSETLGPIQEMPQDLPSARLAAINGAVSPDHPVQAFYVYEQKSGLPEGESKIQWYLSDTKNGPYEPIEGATGKEYQPLESQMYKYLKFSVTPVSSQNGWIGKTVESEARQIKWKLTWSDEFDYTAKDGRDPAFTAKWQSDNSSPSHIVSARYPENVSVSDGTLKLHQKYQPNIAPGKNWTSGSVWTKSQNFGYGYYEARFKYAPTTGLNQSFWLYTKAAGTYGNYEIDINEGHYKRTINSNIHYNRPKADLPEGADPMLPQNRELVKTHEEFRPDYVDTLADDFHTYGLEWNENELLMYLDGNLYRRTENVDPLSGQKLCDPINGKQTSIYFSTAVLLWAGGISDSLDGTAMEVDYVRYYQLEGSAVDKEGLLNALDRAKNATETATIGSNVFEYRKGTVDALNTAISMAQQIADKTDATTEEVNQAVVNLNIAMDEFYGKMQAEGVLNSANPVACVPNFFGKEVTITPLAKDAMLQAAANHPLSANIRIVSPLNNSNLSGTVTMTLPANTRFMGDEGETVSVRLPHLSSSLENVKVPGKIDAIIDMGSVQVSDPVQLILPGCAGKNIWLNHNRNPAISRLCEPEKIKKTYHITQNAVRGDTRAAFLCGGRGQRG